MKRQELLKILNRMGAVLVRRGGKHDVYLQPATNIETTVPRHDVSSRVSVTVTRRPALRQLRTNALSAPGFLPIKVFCERCLGGLEKKQ